MTKAELVARIHSAANGSLTKAQTETAVQEMLAALTDAMVRQDKVTLVGFGSFESVKRAARQGRNPRTGETLRIPESRAVKFTPAKVLREKLNKK